jgi:SM-20-related protein
METINKSFLVYEDYLPQTTNAALFNHAVNIVHEFHESSIVSDAAEGEKLRNWRKSKNTGRRHFKLFYKILRERINEMYPEVCHALNITPFTVKDYEMQMTVHNHGDFYKTHVDNGAEKHKGRMITYVYYFHSTPKAFDGGQLLIFDEKPAIVEPINNRIVFFDSSKKHAVHPITCPDKKFEHSRFTLNGWIWKAD